MGIDFRERDAASPDRSGGPDARQPGSGGDLRARLAALPDWHPSSPRYQPDRSVSDAETEPADISCHAAVTEKVAEGATGWEALGEHDRDRPPLADIRVSAERRVHILDGDQTGGGHRHGVGSPGKTEFPADWDDDTVIANILSIAREPDQLPVRQNWNDRWRVQGRRDGVQMVAIVNPDGLIWSGWPREGSPGVVKNNPKDT